MILAGTPRQATRWGADGVYCAPAQAGALSVRKMGGGRKIGTAGTRSPPARGRRIALLTAHSLREIGRAARADAIVLSPVFATRSHPQAKALGAIRFRMLSRLARVPVIALGGITPRRAAALNPAGWAAIDGLSAATKRGIPKDS